MRQFKGQGTWTPCPHWNPSFLLCGVLHPVPTGVPIGTGWSPHLVPKPLHDATVLPHYCHQVPATIVHVLSQPRAARWTAFYTQDTFGYARRCCTSASSRVGGRVQSRVKHADSHVTSQGCEYCAYTQDCTLMLQGRSCSLLQKTPASHRALRAAPRAPETLGRPMHIEQNQEAHSTIATKFSLASAPCVPFPRCGWPSWPKWLPSPTLPNLQPRGEVARLRRWPAAHVDETPPLDGSCAAPCPVLTAQHHRPRPGNSRPCVGVSRSGSQANARPLISFLRGNQALTA